MESTSDKLIVLLKDSMTARISLSPGIWASWDKSIGQWEIYVLERRKTKLYAQCESIEELVTLLREAESE